MLAGWLTKAAAVFRTASTAFEPFAVSCECGETVTGTRTELQQKVNCAHCGQAVWILPSNVYPVVKPLTAQPTPAPTAKSSAKPVEDEKSPRRKVKRAEQVAAASEIRSAVAPEPPREETVSNSAEEDSLADFLAPAEISARQRRWMLRTAVGLIVVIVFVTGWGLWNRRLREQARSTVPQAAEAGLAALRSGRFTEANAQLGAAVRGLDILAQHDSQAQSIRRASREATAAENLSPQSILDLAEEMLSAVGKPADKQRQFQSQHGSSWMLWDLTLVRHSESSDLWELDVPLKIHDHPLQVHCEFSELLGEAAAQAPRRAIFAAQIDRWLLPEQPLDVMVVVLKPSTGFLWTDYDSFVAAGYQPVSGEDEQQTRELLLRQRQQVLP